MTPKVAEKWDSGGPVSNPYPRTLHVESVFITTALAMSALVAMGGEDTLGVASRLYDEFKTPVVGVPKTMDNDLNSTDFTFGFDTSVAVALDGAERLKDTGTSHSRIMILEVMGRHAGWVALYTGIGSAADWILLPERTPRIDKMCQHLKKVHSRKGVALVVASEGTKLPGHDNLKEQKDEFGHTILKGRGVGEELTKIIESKTGIETRHAVIGHIQRGGPPTLFDRVLGLRVGAKAADLIAAGDFGKMVALKGNNVVPVPLSEATANIKTVPQEWMDFAEIFWK